PPARSVGFGKSRSAFPTFVYRYILIIRASPFRQEYCLGYLCRIKWKNQHNSGNADEKLRTEAATFIWIEDNCPAIPIPNSWEFGFPGVSSTCHIIVLGISPSLSISKLQPCKQSRAWILDYRLHRFINSQMLSETWTERSQSQDLRANLIRDISRIILSLSQLPLSRIGSWTIDGRGVLTLANRPLIHQYQSPENEGIPTYIARILTYTTTNSYYTNLLALQIVVYDTNQTL
ncbi:hypothetical protein LCER1_G005575, partial [Lachnellula cervina]